MLGKGDMKDVERKGEGNEKRRKIFQQLQPLGGTTIHFAIVDELAELTQLTSKKYVFSDG